MKVISRTIQVQDDGVRVTAHFDFLADNKWHFLDLTSNVSVVPVKLVEALILQISNEDL